MSWKFIATANFGFQGQIWPVDLSSPTLVRPIHLNILNLEIQKKAWCYSTEGVVCKQSLYKKRKTFVFTIVIEVSLNLYYDNLSKYI